MAKFCLEDGEQVSKCWVSVAANEDFDFDVYLPKGQLLHNKFVGKLRATDSLKIIMFNSIMESIHIYIIFS